MPGHSGSSTDDEEDLHTNSTGTGHIQFLDLTNGKGGERPPAEAVADEEEEESGNVEEDENDDDEEDGDEEDDGGHIPAASTISALATAMGGATAAARSRVMESGGTGVHTRVVEAGSEHTGRWTKEEHEAFLSALHTYGKEWKKVAAKVKTRTVVQTRTHAQKYFQKLHKTIEQKGEDMPSVDMGVTTEPKKMAAYQSSSQPQQNKKKNTVSIAPKPHRRGSAATMSAAHVITTLSNTKPVMSSAFVATASSSSMMGSTPPPRHGFSVDGWRSQAGMKITAPDPADSRSKFPEPSPAATGKRKLAEIAAARMLAGVGSACDDGPPTPPPVAPVIGFSLKNAPPPPLFGGAPKGLSLQIVNPESLGVTYKKKKSGGEASPVTPWDGELEALVTEKAQAAELLSQEEDDKMSADSSSNNNNNNNHVSNSPKLHPVNGPATGYERSTLHQAVCLQNVAALKSHLEDVAAAALTTTETKSDVDVDDVGVLQRLDEAGYCPLHSACSFLMTQSYNNSMETEGVTNEIVRILLAAGADPARVDGKGNTPLHWAARAGDKDGAERLLQKGAVQDAKNQSGETPLHWAMRAGIRGAAIVAVLLESGARPGVQDNSFHRPIDVASQGFVDDENSAAAMKLRGDNQGKKPSKEHKKWLKQAAGDRRDARANLLIRSAPSRTLVLHHPECLEHHTKSDADWEAPDRVKTIMRRILPSSDPTGATETSGIFPHEVTVSQEFDRANLDLLSRVHSTEYLSFVNNLSKDLEKKMKETCSTSVYDSDTGSPPPIVPFTPMVQRSMIKIDESSVKLGVNSDTSFSAGSLRAARRAAGAVQHAVDCVLVGRNRNAFCVVRPPGHHAGVNGLLEGGESCGFCIFNNVAAGALHAISDDKVLCERCAIVDIDVHHGNGTEEIVRKCHDPSKLFFFSIHLYDNDKKKKSSNQQFPYKFYPGTGSDDDLALNIINVPIVPLWKDTTPASAPAKTHNTRNKTRSDKDTNDDSSEADTPRNSARASDVTSDAGSSNANAAPPQHASAPSGRMAYRQAIQNRLLPALRAFNPDLILISAGFDAAKGDVGNARHERGGERMGLDLEPEDYAWTTSKILEIADICCQGRVVSVLEGGYGRTPPAPSVPVLVEGAKQSIDRTVFGECAVRHLHAMVDPYDAENRFSS